jgi:hypothetical protein
MRNPANLHHDIATAMTKSKRWRLVCDRCGVTQPLTVSQSANYLRSGWPTCRCGSAKNESYTMTMEEIRE